LVKIGMQLWLLEC